MRALIIALVFAVVAFAGTRDLVAEFEAFKAEHKRSYATLKEELVRFQVFTENMKRAEELQKLNPLATFGATKFADMTPEEFKKYIDGEKYFEKASQDLSPPSMFTKEQVAAAAGQSIDWRTKNAVTEVKDQANCGSCWAFSATGSIEGQWAVAGHGLVSLSEQELVSCDTIDDGCDGGLMDNAYKWLLQTHNGSIVTEASYPYVSGTGRVPKCNMDKTVVGATITGFKDLPHNEDQMAAFVYSSGPLGIGVDGTSFQTYRGGIVTNCVSSHMNHGVLAVGFDDNNNPPYWIIKNSWGKGWGEQGYIRVKKGSNQCLLTGLPSTPLVGSGPTPTTGPTPTSGPTPPPSSYFDQFHCTDAKCQNCVKVELPQNQCIQGAVSSYKAVCNPKGLITMNFQTRDCTGDATIVTQPLDVCLSEFNPDHSDLFFLNHCPGGPTPTTGPTQPPGPGPKGHWIDLFEPPFMDVPTIVMAISCVDDGICYVAGGENGPKMFGVYQFDGQPNGEFVDMNIPQKNYIMLMAIGIGGTKSAPHGAVGGIGFLSGGIEYMANTTTFLPAFALETIIMTQDIREINGGAEVLVVDRGKNSVLYSNTYGVFFSESKINVPKPYECTEARYAAMLSSKEWIVTLGSWPDNDNGDRSVVRQLSARVSIERDAKGHVHRRAHSMRNRKLAADSKCDKYSAVIAHTKDGGKTWKTDFSDATNYYFNAIDCNSKKRCVAAAEGFDKDPAAYIFVSTDGEHWTVALKIPSNKKKKVYSLMSVDFSTENEVWVAGGVETALSANALFYYSSDAGATWMEVVGPDYIGDITDMNFLPDGTGFATAVTVFQDSTILKYVNGPTPAPTPTPSPKPGQFAQMQCSDMNCQEGCKNYTFPTYTCLKLQGGGSAIVHCSAHSLIEQIFMFSNDCTGPSQQGTMPLNQCLKAQGGGSFENFCDHPDVAVKVSKRAKLMRA
jgi:cysteine peptidase B